MNNDHPRFLIVILGPTAVGKTSAAIHIAKFFSAPVISADSRQFFREMNIGTACPSADEMKEVPHYFIGHLSVTDNYNVYRFETDALNTLEQLFKIYRRIIMVGGSGLYIRAVCQGIDDLPDPDQDLRNFLKKNYEQYGLVFLQEKLKETDPEFYKEVDRANPKRLLRALEVSLTAGVPYSTLRKNKPKQRSFSILKIGLHRDREELNRRINERVDEMISRGLTGEAEKLLPYRHQNALNTVGYKELFEYFDGKISFEDAVRKIKTNSRRYAKRQLTWFRKDKEIQWFHPGDIDAITGFITKNSKSERPVNKF